MKRYVVDASVVCAAFFQEEHAKHSQALLAADHELIAPDLIFSEVGNVIWKRFRRDEIHTNEALQLLADFRKLPLQITPSDPLIEQALQIAIETGRTVYDSLYLSLAIATKSVLVTGDQRLLHALADGPLEKHLVFIAKYR